MDILDKIGKVAEETCKGAADKTNRLAKEAKFRMKIGEKKNKISDIYEEIGKKVYKHHIEPEIEIENDIKDDCSMIDLYSQEIDEARQEILKLKEKKQCPNCYKQIDEEYKFCPDCGTKQKQTQQILEKEQEQFEQKTEVSEQEAEEDSNDEEN